MEKPNEIDPARLQTAAEAAANLRGQLHACPEPAGSERRTAALLRQFLTEHTSLTLHPCGSGFYAAHREPDVARPAVALRADFDALPLPEGGAAHLCGHDGHAAALCGVALLLEGARLGRDVFLLFQPAEETGEGAKGCLGLLQQEPVAAIYGAHNLPGLPLGRVYTRPGTFACASRGLILRLRGRQTHAATPELGRSPANALGQLLCTLPALAAGGRGDELALCTIVGAQLGSRAFGTAPGEAELWLTLRTGRDEAMGALQSAVLAQSEAAAREAGLGFAWQEQDVFCATVNDAACAEAVLQACGGELLPEPMRWSEDFGQYLLHCPGAFFGIGAGEDTPPLHTAGYTYPDPLLAPTMQAFMNILAF